MQTVLRNLCRLLYQNQRTSFTEIWHFRGTRDFGKRSGHERSGHKRGRLLRQRSERQRSERQRSERQRSERQLRLFWQLKSPTLFGGEWM